MGVMITGVVQGRRFRLSKRQIKHRLRSLRSSKTGKIFHRLRLAENHNLCRCAVYSMVKRIFIEAESAAEPRH